jgi:hypothetical protein
MGFAERDIEIDRLVRLKRCFALTGDSGIDAKDTLD